MESLVDLVLLAAPLQEIIGQIFVQERDIVRGGQDIDVAVDPQDVVFQLDGVLMGVADDHLLKRLIEGPVEAYLQIDEYIRVARASGAWRQRRSASGTTRRICGSRRTRSTKASSATQSMGNPGRWDATSDTSAIA